MFKVAEKNLISLEVVLNESFRLPLKSALGKMENCYLFARDEGACYIYASRPVSPLFFARHAYLFCILRHYRCSKRSHSFVSHWEIGIKSNSQQSQVQLLRFLFLRRMLNDQRLVNGSAAWP